MVSAVRLALLALDLPYQLVEPDLHSLDSTRMMDLLPYFVAQAPTFIHDELTLYDTEAILLYLDAWYGDQLRHAGMATRSAAVTSGLMPTQPRLIGLTWQIVAVIRDHLQPAAIGGVVAQKIFVPHLGGRPDQEKLAAAVARQQDCLQLLEQVSLLCHDGDQADYLIDSQPRLADLLLYPILYLMMKTDLGPACLARSVRLSRWWLAMGRLERLRPGLPVLP
jgi:glutathione S-transferase